MRPAGGQDIDLDEADERQQCFGGGCQARSRRARARSHAPRAPARRNHVGIDLDGLENFDDERRGRQQAAAPLSSSVAVKLTKAGLPQVRRSRPSARTASESTRELASCARNGAPPSISRLAVEQLVSEHAARAIQDRLPGDAQDGSRVTVAWHDTAELNRQSRLKLQRLPKKVRFRPRCRRSPTENGFVAARRARFRARPHRSCGCGVARIEARAALPICRREVRALVQNRAGTREDAMKTMKKVVAALCAAGAGDARRMRSCTGWGGSRGRWRTTAAGRWRT